MRGDGAGGEGREVVKKGGEEDGGAENVRRNAVLVDRRRWLKGGGD